MYVICTCPRCKNRLMEKISVRCLEKQTFESEMDVRKYILENVVVRVVSTNDENIEKVLDVLKTSIKDEAVLNEVVTNLRSVFEANL